MKTRAGHGSASTLTHPEHKTIIAHASTILKQEQKGEKISAKSPLQGEKCERMLNDTPCSLSITALVKS